MRGRRTACTTDNSTRELYHGCLLQAGAINRTGREDTQILPNTAVSSGVGGMAYNTPENPMCGLTHLSPSHSRRGREIEKMEGARCDVSQKGLLTVWEADERSARKDGG